MHAVWISSFSLGLGVAMIGAGALVSRHEPSIWRPASQQGALILASSINAVSSRHHARTRVCASTRLMGRTFQCLDFVRNRHASR
jgi:hypothetical protein